MRMREIGDRDRGRDGVEANFYTRNDEGNCCERNDKPMSREMR